jgi:hypothetical protein
MPQRMMSTSTTFFLPGPPALAIDFGHGGRVGDVTGIDQKRHFRSDQEIHKRRFKGGTKVFPKDEGLVVVRMHLKRRL